MFPISLILNVVWLVFGGFFMGLAWLAATVLALVSIIGIPWVRSCWTITKFTFWPFGKEAVSRRDLYGREDIGTGTAGIIGNIFWLALFGWWIALGHLGSAVATAMTIIGIPLAWQHVKLAVVSLWPIGTEIVDGEVASELRHRRGVEGLGRFRV